ncbi:hypothetical protein HF1_06270 [Mycoplasma haemofelis str. Langford 1]|uniref:Uncharacterized protein n=2 Tax=Mycoplasma haemofelis TaxID=29501 RepID=F6FI98_MYCHI|nr:hypothetical protein [Mycoplasma haemofelis]AEG72946.1 hypothetical protein MHF_0676 [Mycoplasma haemofelis Ohio2]CBY92635.1 hypothetical protein HF1_06270 [Mycoplasma haemofelis str. Langford 1]
MIIKVIFLLACALSLGLMTFAIVFHFTNKNQKDDLTPYLNQIKILQNMKEKGVDVINPNDKKWAKELYQIPDNEEEMKAMKEEVRRNLIYTEESPMNSED